MKLPASLSGRDFDRVFAASRARHGKHLLIRVGDRGDGQPARVGLIVSGKVPARSDATGCAACCAKPSASGPTVYPTAPTL